MTRIGMLLAAGAALWWTTAVRAQETAEPEVVPVGQVEVVPDAALVPAVVELAHDQTGCAAAGCVHGKRPSRIGHRRAACHQDAGRTENCAAEHGCSTPGSCGLRWPGFRADKSACCADQGCGDCGKGRSWSLCAWLCNHPIGRPLCCKLKQPQLPLPPLYTFFLCEEYRGQGCGGTGCCGQ